MNTKNITLMVDGAPYFIKAQPYPFNAELQYHVSLNDGAQTLFAFDSTLGRYRAAGKSAISIPDNVELVIGNILNGASMNRRAFA